MNDKRLWVARSLEEPWSARMPHRSPTTIGRALILTADEAAAAILPAIIRSAGFQPVSIGTLADLRSYHGNDAISLLLCEEQLPDGTFREALHFLAGEARHIPVVVFSRIAEWDNYLEAVRWGAYDCLRYPFQTGEIERIICRMFPPQPFSDAKAAGF